MIFFSFIPSNSSVWIMFAFEFSGRFGSLAKRNPPQNCFYASMNGRMCWWSPFNLRRCYSTGLSPIRRQIIDRVSPATDDPRRIIASLDAHEHNYYCSRQAAGTTLLNIKFRTKNSSQYFGTSTDRSGIYECIGNGVHFVDCELIITND